VDHDKEKPLRTNKFPAQMGADEGQRCRMTHGRQKIHNLFPLQEGMLGLKADVPEQGVRQPSSKDSEGEM
jgi:hypothetical protein